MSQVTNYGEVELSTFITEEQADAINNILGEKVAEAGRVELLFDEHSNKYLDDDLVRIVKEVLEPAGIVANGTIECYGDYDGKIYIDDNKIEYVDIEWAKFMEATPIELLERLSEISGHKIKSHDFLAYIQGLIDEWKPTFRLPDCKEASS